mgnify:CR=1 FL=1
MIAQRTLDDLGWPAFVDHWAKRCATTRGAAAVRAEDAHRVRVVDEDAGVVDDAVEVVSEGHWKLFNAGPGR